MANKFTTLKLSDNAREAVRALYPDHPTLADLILFEQNEKFMSGVLESSRFAPRQFRPNHWQPNINPPKQRYWPECKPMDHVASAWARIMLAVGHEQMKKDFGGDTYETYEGATHEAVFCYNNLSFLSSDENTSNIICPGENVTEMLSRPDRWSIWHEELDSRGQDDSFETRLSTAAALLDAAVQPDMKWLHIELDAVNQFLETDGMIPQRYLQNLRLPFESCAIMYDKPTKNRRKGLQWEDSRGRGEVQMEWQVAFVKPLERYPDHILLTTIVCDEQLHRINNPDYTPRPELTLDDEEAWKFILEADSNILGGLANWMDTTRQNSPDYHYKLNRLHQQGIGILPQWYHITADFQPLILSLKDGSLYDISKPYKNREEYNRDKTFFDNFSDSNNKVNAIELPSVKVGNIYPAESSRIGMDDADLDRVVMGQTVAATLAYTMGKGFSERYTMSRAQRRRMGEQNAQGGIKTIPPKHYMYVNVAPIDEKVAPATGTGTPHGHQYDVRGHVRHTKRRLKDGTIQHNVCWVKPHMRGPEESEYIPKVHSYTGDIELTSPVKKFIIEGQTEQE